MVIEREHGKRAALGLLGEMGQFGRRREFGDGERRRDVRAAFAKRSQAVAEKYRDGLGKWYGMDAAAKIGHAEAFEICEYGRRPDKKEIAKLFPFLLQ